MFPALPPGGMVPKVSIRLMGWREASASSNPGGISTPVVVQGTHGTGVVVGVGRKKFRVPGRLAGRNAHLCWGA